MQDMLSIKLISLSIAVRRAERYGTVNSQLMMTWINRVCATPFLLYALFCPSTRALKFSCKNETCMMENLDLDEGYSFAFSYSYNTIYQLTAMDVKGDIFDLTTLPSLSNLRHFVLDHSQLNSVIVRLTVENSTVYITDTPLKTLIFHESRNLEDVRIDRTLLTTIPETLFMQESLKILFITNSLLTVIDFNLFSSLVNLKYVSFNYNKIHVLHIPATSTCCRQLITLDLQQNRLKVFNFGLLSHMNCLQTLTLRGNRILKVENIEPSEPKPPNLPHICTTDVRDLALMQEFQDSASYSRYASLTLIDLGSNRLREVNLSIFSNMPNLMDLTLSRNLLTSVTVTDGQLPTRLEALELSFNRLANADLRPIFGVKMVNVGGNQ